MQFEDLTKEQQEKAESIKTVAEAMEFIKSENIELSEDQLDDIAGGRANSGHHKFIWE